LRCPSWGYLERYDKPLEFYKASVFRINNKQNTGGDGQTQFGRAMNELTSRYGPHTVKELRLSGISTPEAANAFAEEFMAD
jgi:hypothetical protein